MNFVDFLLRRRIRYASDDVGKIFLDKKLDYAPYKVRRISGPSYLSYGPGASGSETEVVVQYEHYVNHMPEEDHFQNIDANSSRIISADGLSLSEKLSDERYKVLCSRAPKM